MVQQLDGRILGDKSRRGWFPSSYARPLPVPPSSTRTDHPHNPGYPKPTLPTTGATSGGASEAKKDALGGDAFGDDFGPVMGGSAYKQNGLAVFSKKEFDSFAANRYECHFDGPSSQAAPQQTTALVKKPGLAALS
ncbi:expressed unknown protein [Seminavis robusta]|uniref:Uncharacterized protein n=1 Tax=Seminavis robusta TaxID=568900 RepID=A0A9N8DRJ4_9STRA|nr:expressed unknown protein [Seminavis robusta]|eukprot:Sro229_g093160.1 n/a (136) ;mRNA; f:78384-78791